MKIVACEATYTAGASDHTVARASISVNLQISGDAPRHSGKYRPMTEACTSYRAVDSQLTRCLVHLYRNPLTGASKFVVFGDIVESFS